MSVAALVTGLLGTGLVAVVLGIVGLGRTRRNGTAGRGMAIAGIVLGAIATVTTAVALVALLLSGTLAVLLAGDTATSGEELSAPPAAPAPVEPVEPEAAVDDAPAPDAVEDHLLFDAFIGACYAHDPQANPPATTATPCYEPHNGQILTSFHADAGPFPGDEALHQLAEERCIAQVGEEFGGEIPLEQFSADWFIPTQESWEADDHREVYCAVLGDAESSTSLLIP
ncbi:putative regulator of septum formation [Kineococcus xinjiangensis]|uniref:Putative regulator of septum formation n=2 Tax=Kineococcus xinjiangensis TaxID=512762 RepID=A0A2S6IIR8_9ACTN|nr:putative regulator of septum formation [Kineococcus xinjiangensis]